MMEAILIILSVFLVIYIVFSWWVIAEVIDPPRKLYKVILTAALIIIFAPVITPIILGIKVGMWIKDK